MPYALAERCSPWIRVPQGRQRPRTTHANANVAAALEHSRETAVAQALALASYLGDAAAAAAADRVVAALTNASGTLTAALRADYAAFNYAAIGYASLFEAPLRLYDPALRELAPMHLRAYADAAQTVNQLIASATAHELVQEGLECECTCPMCSIGACGCVALGTATINMAWAETAPAPAAGDGFPLQRGAEEPRELRVQHVSDYPQ